MIHHTAKNSTNRAGFKSAPEPVSNRVFLGGTEAKLCELTDMALSKEEILLWRDHVHNNLMMGVEPIKLSTLCVQLENCRAGSAGSNLQYMWLG